MGLLVVGQGCKEDPSSVGLGLLNSGDFPRIRVDTLHASSFSTVSTPLVTYGSDRLLVGKYPSYTAMSILQFISLPIGAMDSVTITSAYLQLRSVYHFGDADAPIAFLGYRMIAISDSATFDSLTTFASNYYSPNPVLTYSPTVVDDTTTIQCPIDTGVVHSWFTTDSASYNYGIILIPTNVSTIKGFGSFLSATSEYYPTLVINYVGTDGTAGSVNFNTGSARFLADIDLTTLEAADPQSMFAQCGVAYRAQLKFHLPSLPKAGLILKATLELTLNPVASNLNSFAADTLIAYPDSTVSAFPVQSVTLTADSGRKVYQFPIVGFVRSWASTETLQQIQFGGLREGSSLDLFALYGTLAPYAGDRPRLIVTSIVQ